MSVGGGERTALGLALAAGMLLPLGCRDAGLAPRALAASPVGLQVQVPSTLEAGSPLSLSLAAREGASTLEATVLLVTSAGTRIYGAHLAGGRAELTIPGSHLRQRGSALIVASAGDARASAAVDIQPGPAVDPVQLVVGARSILADGRHWSMAVVIPQDELGNTLSEGTPVQIDAVQPGEVQRTLRSEIKHQLAWARIGSQTRAGRTFVSAHALGRHGPGSSFDEVPGWPTSLPVNVEPLRARSDGRRFNLLRAGPIVDGFGNVMLDGTLVTFVGEFSDGLRFTPAQTIDGVARALLQAPGQPGTYRLSASQYGSRSAPIEVTFDQGPAVGEIAIEVQLDRAAGWVMITCGPLLGSIQQFVPDGLRFFGVLSHVGLQRNERLELITDSGYARSTVRLHALPPGQYTVAVELGSGRGTTTFAID